jgi:hypothetical protein
MIVHPIGNKTIAINERKQMLRRAIVTAAGKAQRYQRY